MAPKLAQEVPKGRNLQMMNHHSCSNLAQAVGDEEGDGDEAVVADPGKSLQAPLKPNRLHQINLHDKVLISLDNLEVTHQGDLEDRTLADGVEEGEKAKRPKPRKKEAREKNPLYSSFLV